MPRAHRAARADSFLDGRARHSRPFQATALAELVPKRLARTIADVTGGPERLADFSDKLLLQVAADVTQWRVKPNGTEGYRTDATTSLD